MYIADIDSLHWNYHHIGDQDTFEQFLDYLKETGNLREFCGVLLTQDRQSAAHDFGSKESAQEVATRFGGKAEFDDGQWLVKVG